MFLTAMGSSGLHCKSIIVKGVWDQFPDFCLWKKNQTRLSSKLCTAGFPVTQKTSKACVWQNIEKLKGYEGSVKWINKNTFIWKLSGTGPEKLGNISKKSFNGASESMGNYEDDFKKIATKSVSLGVRRKEMRDLLLVDIINKSHVTFNLSRLKKICLND